MTPGGIEAFPAAGVGEVRHGDDLVELLHGAWRHVSTRPQDGDVVVVTSKVVSKAEGRVVAAANPREREAVMSAEADRPVARRGTTTVVRTHHGFVMASAGVDASNVETGSLAMLPLDPDASARHLRDGFALRGVDVGVVVSDTSGRAWRTGQTDIALGAAGLVVLDDHAGRVDRYGNLLAATAPAVADEVAGLAELATGKLSGSPACLVRGLERFVLPRGEHGPGAAALVRPEGSDMFGLGSREAVAAAVAEGSGAQPPQARRGFGDAASVHDLQRALEVAAPGVRGTVTDEARLEIRLSDDRFAAGQALTRFCALARAHGWRVVDVDEGSATAVRDL